jgi:hypothetical protein
MLYTSHYRTFPCQLVIGISPEYKLLLSEWRPPLCLTYDQYSALLVNQRLELLPKTHLSEVRYLQPQLPYPTVSCYR